MEISKEILEERKKVFQAIDSAVNKTFADDAETRKEGRKELEALRGKDSAIPFFTGYAYEIEYYHTENPADAQKAIDEYRRIIDDGYAFLKDTIQKLESKTKQIRN